MLRRESWAFLGALAVFYCVYMVVDMAVLSSFARVYVELECEQSTLAQLYFSHSKGESTVFLKNERSRRKAVSGGSRVELRFDTNNRSFRRLRIDPGQRVGVYALYKITLHSFFGQPLCIDLADPSEKVLCDPKSTLNREGGILRLVSSGQDPYLIIERDLQVQNTPVRIMVPLLAAFISYFFLRSLNISRAAFLQDLNRKRPSSGKNLASLDGLRGIAALFVVAGHTGLPGARGLPMVGVTIFFCLSGFLLTLPFATKSSRITSLVYMKLFFGRRLCRILPMYYFVLTAAYLFSQRFEDYFRSLLFLQGNSIFWTVLQEIHFYILLPLLFLCFHSIFRGRVIFITASLFLLGFACNHGWLPVHTMYGMGQKMPLYLGVFLVGIMAGYIYVSQDWQCPDAWSRLFSSPLVASSIFLLIAFLPSLRDFMAGHRVVESWVLQGNFSYLVGLLILVLAVSGDNPARRFFESKALRLVGLVSYSIYLLHPVSLQMVKFVCPRYFYFQPQGISKFVLTFVLTFSASIVTYSFVERPLLSIRQASKKGSQRVHSELPLKE